MPMSPFQRYWCRCWCRQRALSEIEKPVSWLRGTTLDVAEQLQSATLLHGQIRFYKTPHTFNTEESGALVFWLDILKKMSTTRWNWKHSYWHCDSLSFGVIRCLPWILEREESNPGLSSDIIECYLLHHAPNQNFLITRYRLVNSYPNQNKKLPGSKAFPRSTIR